MRVLGLIPARGGSRRVPHKNIMLLGGKPLLQYTAEAALRSHYLSETILSTDDHEITEVGRVCGLAVPFKRPDELARNDTPMLKVVQHAVRWLEAFQDYFDSICLLRPTNPFRRPEDIDACIELLETSKADAVVTILPVPPEHNPRRVYFLDQSGWLHLSTDEQLPVSLRQDLPPAFHQDGSVHVTRRNVVMEDNTLYGKRLVGYPLNPGQSVNIDTPEDWARAERLLDMGH